MKTNRRDEIRAGGFTLVELLVVVAIIGMLLMLLFPGLRAAMEAGRETQCRSNVHQLALAVAAYDADTGELPNGFRWVGSCKEHNNAGHYWERSAITNAFGSDEKNKGLLLWPYVKAFPVYGCPKAQKMNKTHLGAARSYTMSFSFANRTFASDVPEAIRVDKLSKIRFPDHLAIVTEENWFNWMGIDGRRITVVELNDGRTCPYHSVSANVRGDVVGASWRDGIGSYHRRESSIMSFADGHAMMVKNEMDWRKWFDPRWEW